MVFNTIKIGQKLYSTNLRASDVRRALHAADAGSAHLTTRTVLVQLAALDTGAGAVVTHAGAVTARRPCDAGDLRVAHRAGRAAALHSVVHHTTLGTRATGGSSLTRVCKQHIVFLMAFAEASLFENKSANSKLILE